MTLITITHRMEEALRADRVVVLHQGEVAADGGPGSVLSQPGIDRWGLGLPPVMALMRRLHEVCPRIRIDFNLEQAAMALAGTIT